MKQPDNMKLIDIIITGTEINSIRVDVVREGDETEMHRSTEEQNDHLVHVAVPFSSAPIVGAYAIGRTDNGTIVEAVPLSELTNAQNQCKDDKNKHESWLNWFGEMSKNLALGRLSKRVGASQDARAAIAKEINTKDQSKRLADKLNEKFNFGTLDKLEEEPEKVSGTGLLHDNDSGSAGDAGSVGDAPFDETKA